MSRASRRRLSRRRAPRVPASSGRARARERALRAAGLPTRLHRAAEFSDDSDLRGTRYVLDAINRYLKTPRGDGIWDELLRATTVKHDTGRPREPRDWPLAYAGFVMSALPRLTKYVDDYGPMIGPLAGFSEDPKYSTAHLRFSELEGDQFVAAIEHATDRVIELVRGTFPQVGRNVYCDGTPFHSRARLHRLDEGQTRAGKKRRRLERATDDFIKAEHQAEVELAEDEVPGRDVVRGPVPESPYPTVVYSAGEWYGCLDPTAAIRCYTTSTGEVIKWWIGGIEFAVVDFFTGLVLASVCIRADQSEADAFFPAIRRVERTLGGCPEAFTGDRGLGVNKVYHWAAKNKVDAVVSFRRPHSTILDEQDMRCEEYDEHGPRCRSCGGPCLTEGPRLGIQFRDGKPRLHFRCMLRLLPECQRVQSLDPLAYKSGCRCLTAISRFNERYHALAALHSTFERTFRHQRERYAVAGADQAGKLRRFGVPAQRLRSAMATFLDWFRFALRFGILGDHRKVRDVAILYPRGERRHEKFLLKRRNRGLNLPYGNAAQRAGFALTADIPPPDEQERADRKRGSPRRGKTRRNK